MFHCDLIAAAKSARRRACVLARTTAASALIGLLGSPVMAQQAQNKSFQVRESGKPIRFMISGHSLTDNPLPEYITAIATSQGFSTTWNQQNIIGSPIRCRTAGCGPGTGIGIWAGYRQGKNNNDRRNLDIVAELREKREANAYNTLIIAEGHRTIASILYNETVRFLRHFHELLIEGNPDGVTYLYEPWEEIKDLGNPQPWIALERDATKVWGCVTTRINASLAHENRKDRIKSLPIAAGLAELIERATSENIKALSGATTEQTVERFLSDKVHLTRTGIYYVALLNYVGMTGRPPQASWRPDFLSAEQAIALQEIAWSFYKKRNSTYRALALPECRRFMVNRFCDMWDSYVHGQHKILGCKPYFDRESTATNRHFPDQNPFVFDATTDAGYWFPPP